MKSGRRTPCRKGCCWNPFGTCGRQGMCPCHEGYREREELATVIDLESRRLRVGRIQSVHRQDTPWMRR